MYTMFVRSTMEYGSVAFMGAATTHLQKLDRVNKKNVLYWTEFKILLSSVVVLRLKASRAGEKLLLLL